MAATALLPNLSQIEAWKTEHLDASAAHWTSIANTWEDAFTTVYREAPLPGGTPWDGEAAEAAVLRVGSDRVTALAAVDALHDAASTARSGAAEIQAAKQLAIDAVQQAEASGFIVGQDLSVTERITGDHPAFQGARKAQAEALAATIRSRAAALATVDERVAGQITTAAAPLSGIRFAPNPVVPPKKKPKIQAVDNHVLPQEPPPQPDPNGSPKPIKTGQDVKDYLGTLEPGRREGVVTLPTESEIEEAFNHLTDNAADAPRSNYPGTSRMLPDGTRIGLRQSTKWGPTIDVRYPDGSKEDVHLPDPSPVISASPTLPRLDDSAPNTITPAQVTHPPTTSVPPAIATTPLLPPWSLDPSPLGFQITPGQSTTMPWEFGLSGPTTPDPVSAIPQAASSQPPFTLPSLPQPAPVTPQDAAGAATATAGIGGLALLLAVMLAQN